MTTITGELKSRVDKLWEEFWTGGIANPLTVIEQITFLMFARLLDITETRNEKRAARTKKPFKRIFSDEQQHLRWSQLKHIEASKMHELMRDELFPLFKTIGEIETPEGKQKTTFSEYFKDARLEINKPDLLVSAFNMIDDLPLTRGDTKGDLYEYLLSKLTTAGINGQFRTPRHIIRLMVEMLDPKPTDSVVDPACGTAGFLVGVMEHLLREHTDEDGSFDRELEENWGHIQKGMFHGFDFDATMLRIAAMNMLLHGVDSPDIHYQDTLGGSFTERYPKQAEDGFDFVLANPPFKGSLDYDSVHPGLLRKVKTKKTELLFIALILRMLKNGGRCAVVVPDGVLSGSSKAHQAIKKQLVDQNQLEAIVSLPSGVFKPYAGVKTAILVFTKGGRTDNIWFFDLLDDGFELDDRRVQKYDSTFAGDLPKVLLAWRAKELERDTDRSKQAFFVPAKDIRNNRYDLLVSRYKEVLYEKVEFVTPKSSLLHLQNLNAGVANSVNEIDDRISNFLDTIKEYGDVWSEVELGELCYFENGDRGKNYPSRNELVEKGIPFINAGNLKNYKVEASSLNYITEDKFAILSNGKIQEEDILFCLRGTLGKFGVVTGFSKGAIASSLVIIRPQDGLARRYLEAYLRSYLCDREIESFRNGVAQPNLSLRDLKKFKIPLPPIEVQNQFAVLVMKHDLLREKLEASRIESSNLYKSLSQLALGGEL